MSELRTSGTNLAALCVVMLAGLLRPVLDELSMLGAVTFFSAFAFGRLVSIVPDRVPSGSILGALVIELDISGLCIIALALGRKDIPFQAKLSGLPG